MIFLIIGLSIIGLMLLFLLHIYFEAENVSTPVIQEYKIDLGKLKSAAEVAMNPPQLPSPNHYVRELSYRETIYCHHCGCNCRNNKIVDMSALKRVAADIKKQRNLKDDDPFGPPR